MKGQREKAFVAVVVGVAISIALILAPTSGGGLQSQPGIAEIPRVNIAQEWREQNWFGNQREGSCVWASLVPLLRWQGKPAIAEHLRATTGNGVFLSELPGKLDRLGIRYAYTSAGDVAFLNWCIETRRGAAVPIRKATHMVTLVHFDAKRVGLIDNRWPEKIEWRSTESFLVEWRRSGGWAFTPLYSPAAPLAAPRRRI